MAVDEAKSSFDFMLNSSALCAVTAAGILLAGLTRPVPLQVPGRWPLWLLQVLVFASLAYWFYLLSIAILLLALSLRAQGFFSSLPAPWGLRASVPVVAYDLRKDKVLRRDDLADVWLNPRHDQFQSRRQVEGLRAARDLEAGSILRFRDVLREQVVALRDLPQGSAVPAAAVVRRWSSYAPDAILETRQVEGFRALRSIRRGEILSTQDLAPAVTRRAGRAG